MRGEGHGRVAERGPGRRDVVDDDDVGSVSNGTGDEDGTAQTFLASVTGLRHVPFAAQQPPHREARECTEMPCHEFGMVVSAFETVRLRGGNPCQDGSRTAEGSHQRLDRSGERKRQTTVVLVLQTDDHVAHVARELVGRVHLPAETTVTEQGDIGTV